MEWEGVDGKRVLITGATSGIGLATAAALAGLGAKLAIVARNKQKADEAVELIKAVAGSKTKLDVLYADLSSQASVRKLAGEVLFRYPSLQVLVNNAGAIYDARQLSKDGIELTWAVNHLAPFLLTTMLLERIKRSAPARIITTASDGHVLCREIPFDDLSAKRSYCAFIRYAESKLANILFTQELARRLSGTNVTANCFHPGVVATGFNQNNGPLQRAVMTAIKPFLRTPQEGARTLVWLANASEAANKTGLYFVDEEPVTPGLAARDLIAARKLWRVSEEQCLVSARIQLPAQRKPPKRGQTQTYKLHLMRSWKTMQGGI